MTETDDRVFSLIRAVEWIEHNLDESFALEDIARVSLMSLSHLHRLFSHAFGVSLKEYVVKRRLCRAAERLVRSSEQVTEIAFSAFYSDLESFTRAFKRQFRVTPSEFRKRHRFTALYPMMLYSVRVKERSDGIMSQFRKYDVADLTEALLKSTGTYIMCVDIDHLKPINDDIGVGAGDIAIAETAKRIDLSTPEGSCFFRIGGDEFIVVTASKDASAVEAMAKAILSYSDTEYEFAGKTFKVSVSIGVALVPDSFADLNDGIKRADEAMYTAKRKGRNSYYVVK